MSLEGGSNVICESPPKPFIQKGVSTLITITITSEECTVSNPEGVKLPIQSPNEANFRNCYASTDSGSQTIIEIETSNYQTLLVMQCLQLNSDKRQVLF